VQFSPAFRFMSKRDKMTQRNKKTWHFSISGCSVVADCHQAVPLCMQIEYVCTIFAPSCINHIIVTEIDQESCACGATMFANFTIFGVFWPEISTYGIVIVKFVTTGCQISQLSVKPQNRHLSKYNMVLLSPVMK